MNKNIIRLLERATEELLSIDTFKHSAISINTKSQFAEACASVAGRLLQVDEHQEIEQEDPFQKEVNLQKSLAQWTMRGNEETAQTEQAQEEGFDMDSLDSPSLESEGAQVLPTAQAELSSGDKPYDFEQFNTAFQK